VLIQAKTLSKFTVGRLKEALPFSNLIYYVFRKRDTSLNVCESNFVVNSSLNFSRRSKVLIDFDKFTGVSRIMQKPVIILRKST